MSRPWCALLALGVVLGVLGVLVETGWAPLLGLDLATTRDAQALDALVAPARVLTQLGDPVLATLGSLALGVALLARGERRLALLVVLSRVGAMVLGPALKALTDRVRPVLADPVATAAGSSFPSGHALGAAAFWGAAAVVALALLPDRTRPWVVAGAVGVPVVVAATRVLLGVHYLTDVIAGLLLGFGWVALLALLLGVGTRARHLVERA